MKLTKSLNCVPQSLERCRARLNRLCGHVDNNVLVCVDALLTEWPEERLCSVDQLSFAPNPDEYNDTKGLYVLFPMASRIRCLWFIDENTVHIDSEDFESEPTMDVSTFKSFFFIK